MRRLPQPVLLVLAMLTCPCHLPVYLALLAGTGPGVALTASSGPLTVAMLVVFIGVLALALRPHHSQPGNN